MVKHFIDHEGNIHGQRLGRFYQNNKNNNNENFFLRLREDNGHSQM